MEAAYFVAWRMMGFGYHIRFSMYTERYDDMAGLNAPIQLFGASDLCAWNVMLLARYGIEAEQNHCRGIFWTALRVIERVYEIEERPHQLARTCGLESIQSATLFDVEQMRRVMLEQFGRDRGDDLQPLINWYETQTRFSGFAEKLVRSLSGASA